MLIDSDYSTEFKSKKETIDKMESILNGGSLSQVKAQLAQEKKKSMITAGKVSEIKDDTADTIAGSIVSHVFMRVQKQSVIIRRFFFLKERLGFCQCSRLDIKSQNSTRGTAKP